MCTPSPPRDFSTTNNQTPACVGPSTYFICSDRDNRVNPVPFLSSEKKQSKFFNKVYCEAFYSLPEPNITGGSTPRSRAKRFVHDDSDTPGPEVYDVELPKCHMVDPKPIPGKGRLYACRVPYTTQGSAPSVPTKIDANGYRIDKLGNIVKIPLAERDKTMGPAYYHVKTSTFCEFYRGCRWSHRTSKRSPPCVENTPGPAAYDIQLPKCKKTEEEEEVREVARRLSFIPRFIEAQQLKFQREGLPGPADYDVRKFKLCRGSPSVFPKPFVTGSDRFKRPSFETPSPAKYDIKTIKYPISKKVTPFSVESLRFGGKEPFVTPGPGAYEIKSPINEKLRSKKNEFALFEPPFNKTSPRDVSCIRKDAAFTPSPAHYDLNVEGKCKMFISSVFKSKVERVKKLCKKKGLCPASYDASVGYHKLVDQRSHNVVNVSFNAITERTRRIGTDNPGPADYLGQDKVGGKGYYMAVSPRFKDLSTKMPGPGAYSIHPAYDSSVYKAVHTHNLCIKENVLRKKLRRHPNKTWSRWASTLKKRKQLRWFNRGRDYV